MRIRIGLSVLLAFAALSLTLACQSGASTVNATATTTATATAAAATQSPGSGNAIAASAQASANAAASAQATPQAAEELITSAFVKENLKGFSVATLDNGIKVVVKTSDANRLVVVKTVLDGNVSLSSKSDAGIESIMVSLMARGSLKYNYEKMQKLLYDRSASIVGQADSFDMSSLSLVVLDKYFDELLPVYASCLVEPAFDPADFDVAINEARLSYQNYLSDPYNAATVLLHEDFFRDHPYQADFQGNDASLSSINLEAVKAYYQKTFAPERMTIVVVGNVKADEVVAKLNASLGAIKAKGLSLSLPPLLKARNNLIVKPWEQAAGLAYVRGDFPLPKAETREFLALQLGFEILNDLLMDVVRTKHGACYSVWIMAKGDKSPYGSIGVYKTATPDKIKSYLDEAIKILLSGKTMDIGNKGGGYQPISDTISFYKASFITGRYSLLQTNGSIAYQIASSSILFGDYAQYLYAADRVSSLSASEVLAALDKYLGKAAINWIVLGDPSLLSAVSKEAYAMGFSE